MMPFSWAACSASATWARDRQRFRYGERSSREPLHQRTAFDELEDQEACGADLFETVDRGDVRVIERGEDPRLALKAGDAIRVGTRQLGKGLDRDVASEPRIARSIDLAHPAGTNRRDDLVRTNSGAGLHGGNQYSSGRGLRQAHPPPRAGA